MLRDFETYPWVQASESASRFEKHAYQARIVSGSPHQHSWLMMMMNLVEFESSQVKFYVFYKFKRKACCWERKKKQRDDKETDGKIVFIAGAR